MRKLPYSNEFIELLKTCKDMGINFSLQGRDLKILFPNSGVSPLVLDQIKKYKSELIILIEGQGMTGDDYGTTVIEPAPDQFQGPLSTLQRSMWYAKKFADDEGLLCYYANTRINGFLDIEALSTAVSACLRKHPALRMLLSEDSDGNTIQKVADYDDYDFLFIDCRGSKNPEYFLGIENIKKGFNLENDIKLKTALFQLENNTFDFMIAMHHCVTDGWSIDVLIKDISYFYKKFIKHKSIPEEDTLPDSPSWLDYVYWLEKQYQSPKWKEAKKYWPQRLANAPEVHGLPLDKPRPAHQSFCTNRFVRRYPEHILHGVKSLALAEGTSVFVVLLSAISLLISKLSNEHDIIIGTSAANRPREELTRIVGLFTNVICMRITCQMDSTYKQFLKLNHQHFIQDMEYQFLPFEDVVSLQNMNDRSLRYSPLVQILFIMQNNDFHGFDLANTHCVTSHLNSGKSQYDIAISGLEEDDCLDLYWDYSSDIFSEQSISIYGDYLENIISEIVKNPNRQLFEYSLMSSSDKNKIFYNYGGLQRYFDRSLNINSSYKSFVEIFTKIANLNPNRVAVTCDGQSLTYKQLDCRSNRLCSVIKNLPSFKSKNPIAVFMSPSTDLFIAIMGILKCGAAFVPLDKEYPLSRLQDCINQANITMLLVNSSSQSSAQSLLKDNKSLSVINVQNQDLNLFDDYHAELVDFDKNTTAYIIFTSGSTGKPKGVIVNHEALSNFCYMQSKFTLADTDSRVLQMASISFDAAIYEMVMAFTSGAELVVAHKEILKIPSQLNDFVEEHRITHSSIPPALLSILDFHKWSSVKMIFLGGEKCPLDQLQKWSRGRRLYHAYGPTESTVFVTAALCEENMLLPHIGKVVETSYCYVLDENLQPVPPNVVGELFIGGSTLALGYIANPEQTSEQFIQDPFIKTDSKIIYRTGDLVKWLPDGNLEFIGRRDNQVKIRGYRIELEEIKSLLLKYEDIDDALVITNGMKSDKSKIYAYIIVGINFSNTELMDYLKQHLPAYMIPSEIIEISEFSLTINKKIDVSALPRPEKNKLINEDNKPKTEMEYLISNLWKEELNLAEIALHQNFFSIGANSLAISRVASKLNKLLNASIPLTVFIENQTVFELSSVVDTHMNSGKNLNNPIISINHHHESSKEFEITEL